MYWETIRLKLKALTGRKEIGIATGVFLIALGTFGQITPTSKKEIAEPGLRELFNMALYQVKTNYVEETSTQTLFFGAIRGMLAALDDPHTRFMDSNEFNELNVETRGNFGGLGIEISMRDGWLTVVSPIEDTPAMRAGLKPGDKIVEINKKSTRGISLKEAVEKLRGTPGTTVNITVSRKGEDELLHFDIVREKIKIKVVESTVIKDSNLGYVKLKQFSGTAPADMKKVLEDFNRKKVKGIILDLRWNPGGLLSAAHRIANYFIDNGVIVSTRGRKKELDRVFSADPDQVIIKDTPLVILANQGSASASEIVTGAVKDHKRGKFVGVKTFGKGSVQNVIPLMYNTAMALTIQKYYTPSGVCIHKIGIKPDYEVKPQDFTKDDNRHYRELSEKGEFKKFFKTHSEYNDANVQALMKMAKSKGLPLTKFAARLILYRKSMEDKKRPIYNLEFDNQLQKAIEILKKA